MKKKWFTIIGLSVALAVISPAAVFADTAASATVTMEPCGAYLFEWRPVDCGNGRAFAILVGGNTLTESDVILKRGYDYNYTFNPNSAARPWGTVPDLVNYNGIWAVPDNERQIPDGIQPTLQITLLTNNKNMDTNERYIDVVHLPDGTDISSLPPEVRKYLINVDGSDAGAYDGTVTSGWFIDGTNKKYRNYDGTFVTNTWMSLEEESYYFDENGVMLTDTITPDGIYVNANGEKTSYLPGWKQVDGNWRYIQKNGYYVANDWVTDNGKSYYFNLACNMVVNTTTPDGYYVGEDGAWDGNPSANVNKENVGPAGTNTTGWIKIADDWKYIDSNGEYTVNDWRQSADGGWYYLGYNGNMLKNQTTPDGYYVDAEGLWDGMSPAE